MFITPAFAQAAGNGAGAGAGGASFLVNILPLILIFAILYFMIIRPQNKRMREHRDMIAALRRGDTVVTGGGIVGKVANVEDNEVLVEIAEGVKIKVVKSTITEVRSKIKPVANDDKSTEEKK